MKESERVHWKYKKKAGRKGERDNDKRQRQMVCVCVKEREREKENNALDKYDDEKTK